ncbi:LysR family transcriptional regulator [Vibrio tritonius]|uniref:LysR family transcriptional regulator n=1 Tax=Vibrio tritonius TaxID=1435069 RepID=A0ABS7YPW1_9VIBR|nr:LysR family transcriptional regulator [Vibrio tritonius]MCA2017413.1 LysR family transcriptional regulator [Vibrio tritonius]
MLSLEQIRMLVLSAELGSFSACARKMGKVQSAVSHGINTLEIDLGVELFDRSARNPVLTPAGERLLRSAKTLVAQSDDLERMANSIHHGEESSLMVAYDDGLFTPKLAQLFNEFSNQFPYIQLDLRGCTSTDISDEIVHGETDLGIMFSEIETIKQVDFCYVGSIDYIAVCHPSFPLATHTVTSASDLTPYRQIAVRGRKKQESQSLITLSPKVWWCSSYHTVMELAKAQIGWAYLPAFMVKEAIEQRELINIQVAFDHKPWSVPVDLVFKKGANCGPAYQWLFDELKRTYAG